MTVDMKTQQINALAAQFNQLVLVWQQQVTALQTSVAAQTPSGPIGSTAPVAGVGSTPTAVGASVGASGSTSATAAVTTTPTPTPTSPGSTLLGASPSMTPGPLVSLTPDQLRAQIAAVSQRMTAVSNDPTLSAAAKTRQLQDLGAQFNQLVQQLRQLGG